MDGEPRHVRTCVTRFLPDYCGVVAVAAGEVTVAVALFSASLTRLAMRVSPSIVYQIVVRWPVALVRSAVWMAALPASS
jgi:hypothetical protein